MREASVTQVHALPYFGIPKLLPYLKPYAKVLLLLILPAVTSSLIDTTFPLFHRYAIDHFIAGKTTEGFPVFVTVYALALFALLACDFVTMYFLCRVEIDVGKDLKNAAFSHLQTLSFSFFNQNNVGYVHARIMSDTARIGGLISWRYMEVIWNGSYILCMIIMMLVVDVRLALCVLLLVPLLSVCLYFFQKEMVRLHRLIRESNSRITSGFNEGITGAKTIKILAAEEVMENEFHEETGYMKRTAVLAERWHAFLIALVVFMGALALALILYAGGALTMEGLIRIGTLSVFVSYAMSIMEPVQLLAETVAQLVQVQVNIERLTRLLQTESDVADTSEVIARYGDTFVPKKENWEELHGDVTFEDVSFTYPDGNEIVLSRFNLDVPHGTNVAIVGETGAGKSTLVNLVCRFFEPTAGRVLIDGRDARQRSQLWLHSHIGYVLQSPHLFSGTIRENLQYGKEDATDEEMWRALRLVSAEDMVKALKDGLDTQVGEGGSFLSTGEKQLLSFARALLANPRILVLDEATSSIDTVTEKKVQEAMQIVTKGRTSFVIAHRLSTVTEADVILVVKDGAIVEQGTHTALMQNKGYYYELYARQYDEEAVQKATGGQ